MWETERAGANNTITQPILPLSFISTLGPALLHCSNSLMVPALSGRPAGPAVQDQQDSDEILGILRDESQAGVVQVRLTGQNVLLQLDRVPG